ncbi:PREDICTED: organic cation transporter protein-like [Priapulus caudatus]|uniref:Organic cation transporter protein-like n=1 Tax=Priapulus caudatus TaxID=37621 RepID=A0ABM1DTK9_PRICU|nr:PREDICTED: organic cation transporter protein-like [Priapulus caudatus]
MLGFLVGCIIPAYLADMKGRKWTFMVTSSVFAVSATVAAFSPNFTWFLLFRFLIGASGSAAVNSIYIYALENVGQQYRNRVTSGVGAAYCLGYALDALCAYIFRDWRHLQLAISVCLFLLPLWYFAIPESPRWLYAEGRVDDCDKALRRVAKTNKTSYPDHVQLKLDAKKHMIVTADGSAREPNFTDILRTPNMRKNSINLMYQWFVVSMVYYGLAMNSANLGTDPYLSFAAAALVGLPGKLFGAIILKYLGRRLSLSGTMLLAGITCLVTALPWPAHLNWVIVTLATIGVFASTCTYGICYLYSGELYPTVIRNIGLGSNSTWARVSAILAPYVALLGMYRREYPLLIFGVLAISAGIAALFLPETKDRELPETLEDGENFGKHQKFWTLLPQTPANANKKHSSAIAPI